MIYVEVWCNDCLGVDPQGCFDGGSEIIEFASEEDAADYERHIIGLWQTVRLEASPIGRGTCLENSKGE